jgi:hypothetical protein
MKLLGKRFTSKVLNREVQYSSAKHKMNNVRFAIEECSKAYDLENLIKVAEEGLRPWNEGLGGFPPSVFPIENEIRRLMVSEGIYYDTARAIVEKDKEQAEEDLFGGLEDGSDENTGETTEGTESGTSDQQSSEKEDNEGPSEGEQGTEETVQPEEEAPKQRPKVTGKVTKRRSRRN